jgi:hypothetical protein
MLDGAPGSLPRQGVSLFTGEPGSGSSQPRLTPAEISQRSVDLLLREYYKVRLQAMLHTHISGDSCASVVVPPQ